MGRMEQQEKILNIVIVEDETNIRECLVHLFPWERLGIRVLASFAGGQDAFYYIMSHEVDIVLSDIRLQGMGGLDMVKLLRDNNNQVAVIILTGYRQFQYMQQSIRYHVSDFLLKPIKYEELTASLMRIREELEDAQGRIGAAPGDAPLAASPASSRRPADSPAQGAADGSPSFDAASPENDASAAGSPVTGAERRLVSAARSYMQAHLLDASLEQAAMTVGISPSYLSRLFHKVSGETFSDYLMRLRMEKAGALLKKQDYRLYDVALQVGYDNPKNFSRAFRNYYQCTPSQYRNAAQ